jgi:hypothetical protein
LRGTSDDSVRREYCRACRSANMLINKSCCDHYRQRLGECFGNPAQKCRVVQEPLHSSDRTSSDDENSSERCQTFSNFHASEIASLKSSVSANNSHFSHTNLFHDPPFSGAPFASLSLATPDEVQKLIILSPLKYSQKDFIPLCLIKSCSHLFGGC